MRFVRKLRLAGRSEPVNNYTESKDSFLWLDGRRHINNAPYVLPSDEQEIHRLDFQHYMLRYALHGNYVAPIQGPQKILDIGCGTERWAHELATQFPQAEVVGVDIVPPQVRNESGPLNYHFVQGNVLDKLPFPNSCFDFVHMRLLLFAIPAKSWPQVAKELIRVTKPGGWIESVETGAQQQCGPAMERLVYWINEAGKHRDVNLGLGPAIGEYLQQAGLTEVKSQQMKLPIGPYGDRLGRMAQTDTLAVVNGIKGMCIKMGITTTEEYDKMVAQATIEIEANQGTLPFYIAYGRRM